MGLSTTLRSPQDILTIGIKPHTPKSDSCRQLLGSLQFPVPAKNCLDELPAGIVAHVQFFTPTVALSSLKHVLLTHFQQLVEALPKSFSTVEEIINEFAVVAAADARQGLLSALDFASKLDEREPEITGHFGDGSRGSVESYCPVVDPFTKAVCVEDAAKKKDWLFIWVPVLEVVAGGNTCCSCIAICGNGAFGWCLLTRLRWWFARCRLSWR